MRVRIKRRFFYAKANRFLSPGDVIDIPESEADIWQNHGMAMQDKSMDAPSETKETKTQPQRKPIRRKTR